ncbi:hypothetical protein INS49_012256 [Diaporthe citri]|uniref:uncharacterized protein n=1 Tax=Diaporthe citri TaxID=83186 RepID=UPI001C7F5306|nr:uncharacterized protein INS49_012256 [Diaporthe citri]KAG6358737.1 hypothetical protein INS49_012256 [Diaporthe citri]
MTLAMPAKDLHLETQLQAASREADVMCLVLVGAAACGVVHAFRETFEVYTPSFEARVI